MSTSVFFTNNYIRVVVGTGKKRSIHVKKAYQKELPEGCLINGMITNEHDLSQAINELWTAERLPKKGVQVVTASSHFTIKNMKVPVMNRKKTRAYVVNGFPEVESGEQMIYDYQVIGRDKASKLDEVLAVMAEKEIVDGFVQLFKGLGIVVDSVGPSNCSLLVMFQRSGVMKGRNCIVQLAEGHDLRSLVYMDGKYIYSSKARLFSNRGSEEIGSEVARSVSGILQFLMTQENQVEAEEVCLAGFLPPELENSKRSIDFLERGLKVSELAGDFVKMPQDAAFGDYVSPIADLMSDKDSVNLVQASKVQAKKHGKGKEIWKRIRPVVFLTILLGAVSGALLFMNMSKERELEELESYNNNPANIAAYQESLMLQQQVGGLLATMEQVERFNGIKDSYPWANSTVMAAVHQAAQGLAEVTISSYQADTGSLMMTATALDVTAINQFIDALEYTGIFGNVQYSGYSLSQRDKQQMYSINVSCYLAENAGK